MFDAVTRRTAHFSSVGGAGQPMPLSVRDVSLGFGQTAVLEHVSFELGPSGCTVILGPNGAGKSVLLKALHGLETPDKGQILWAGQSPERVMHQQALVFQKPVLLRRTVRANLEFVLRARGKPLSRAEKILQSSGLADKAAHPARKLSGGEAQRLALARALSTEPLVLLLDEPTASLDPGSTLDIERTVMAACRSGTRIIFVTHDIAQARRIADDVVFLAAGRVVEHAQKDQFFAGPQSVQAQDYLAGRLTRTEPDGGEI